VYRLDPYPAFCFQKVRTDFTRRLYRLESREQGTRADKFAFPHCATLEQNLRFPNNRPRSTRWPAIGMPTSFSCQRSSFRPSTTDRNVSAPSGAQCRFGAGPAIENLGATKNPASSAGQVRPSRRPLPRPLGRHSSLLDVYLPGVRNQPHLYVS